MIDNLIPLFMMNSHQVMVSVMYRRPRYDVEAPYFIRTYINESQIMAQWTSLTQEMANMTVRVEICIIEKQLKVFCKWIQPLNRAS